MAQMSDYLDLVEEISNCPYCRCSGKQTFVTKNDLRIVRCLGCGLGYADRRWNRQGALLYYQEGYYTGKVPGAYKNYEAEEREKLIDFNYKYRFLKKFISGGMLLDVGCATGFSLLAAQSHGFVPEGIELSEWAVRRNKTGLRILHADITELEGENRYDAISMWDVIEHILEPENAFRRLSGLLRPGGLLIFTYPDPTSCIARMLGKRWGVLTPEEHYFFYPPMILEDLLKKTGFRKLYECHEKRYVTLGKLLQKIAPSIETPLNEIGIGSIVLSFRIPYKRMAVFKKVDQHG